MDPAWSTREAITNTSRWGWRWHYRAVTVQRLIAKYVECFLEAEGMDEDTGPEVRQAGKKTSHLQ